MQHPSKIKNKNKAGTTLKNTVHTLPLITIQQPSWRRTKTQNFNKVQHTSLKYTQQRARGANSKRLEDDAKECQSTSSIWEFFLHVESLNILCSRTMHTANVFRNNKHMNWPACTGQTADNLTLLNPVV